MDGVNFQKTHLDNLQYITNTEKLTTKIKKNHTLIQLINYFQNKNSKKIYFY
jgi:hypothetical protein